MDRTAANPPKAFSVPRWALIGLAIIFAAGTVIFTVSWVIAVRWSPPVELGFDSDFDPGEQALVVTEVRPDSPAKTAGLLVGDRILGLDDRLIQNQYSLFKFYKNRKAGDRVQLTVRRRGARLSLTGVFRRRPQALRSGRLSRGEYLGVQVQSLRGIPFVVVGLAVLFFRLEDRRAWLLALLSGSLAASGGFPDGYAAVPSAFRPFVITYQAVFFPLLGSLFYLFFAVFPTRSPIDRHFPWLKWVGLALAAGLGLPGLGTGLMRPPAFVANLIGDRIASQLGLVYTLLFLILGLVALAATAWTTEDPEARRKIRVVLWGTLAGVGPPVVHVAAENLFRFQSPWWLRTSTILVTFLFPLSFAYAVVRHRVLEIPVLLKRSARYLLVQRGFTIMLALLSAGLTLLFAVEFEQYLPAVVEDTTRAGAALGVGFGTLLLWTGTRVHTRVSGRIDRAFFRDAYDARVVLQDLTEKTRTATSVSELAVSLQGHLEKALHPRSLAFYVRQADGSFCAVTGAIPEGYQTISADSPVLTEIARRRKPFDLSSEYESKRLLDARLPGFEIECLVPMPGRSGNLFGVLILGPRLSEEPYSGEDNRLLAAVASQAGIALENIRLAEEIAERMESERRAVREMEIAKEVQRRLLPQAPPSLRTLECAAQCIQARSVGGDYFDFLDLGNGRVGFVLADVSGKGVHAALLVANLQAQLRSQSRIAPLDPVRLLREVNLALWESTAPEHYATLFFAIYDDTDRSLRYLNCGHNPPLWFRADGNVERLAATATVVGLFEQWESEVARIELSPSDTLVMFSDGITEASRGDEEFGEDRLVNMVKAVRCQPAVEVVSAVLESVQQFGSGSQSDDLTLLVLRSLPDRHTS